MGAQNCLVAYRRYAGKVPPLSMVVLGYMALMADDMDQCPVYSNGHESLAFNALGRPLPVTDADLRQVRRAIKPLLDTGAIRVVRRQSGRRDGLSTVAYALILYEFS